MKFFKFFTVLFSLTLTLHLFAADVNISFAEGKWDQNQWLIGKSPRWPNIGRWEQGKDHIFNWTPANATDRQLRSKLAREAYAAMIMKNLFPVGRKIEVSSTMSFDGLMAPLIVVADNYEKLPSGVIEFREHWEIVLYYKGINVWHHYWKDNKPGWIKAAHLNTTFKPGTRYDLKVTILNTAKGRMLEVSCNGHEFGCALPGLGDKVYVGIIGCEGVNRFYDFKVKSTPARRRR